MSMVCIAKCSNAECVRHPDRNQSLDTLPDFDKYGLSNKEDFTEQCERSGKIKLIAEEAVGFMER